MKIAILSSHTPTLFYFRLDMMHMFGKLGYEVVAIILCLMGTGIFVFFCDLKMGIVLLVLVLYFKYKLCEVKMAKIYDLPVIKNSFIELLFLIFFEIIINLKIEISALLNISIYLIFFLYKKQEFFNAWRQIQKILR